jgi:hypothetical protein
MSDSVSNQGDNVDTALKLNLLAVMVAFAFVGAVLLGMF